MQIIQSFNIQSNLIIVKLDFRLDVVVYYDEMLLQQYRNSHEKVKGKLRAVMALVREVYSEKDSLKTVIKVNTVAIEYAQGQNWGTREWR